jgi:hypothetical protein
MTTTKLFTVAGISTLNGVTKVRFANDIMRIKVLAKSGHEDIRLVDLEGEYTKLAAAELLLSVAEFGDSLAQMTITDYIAENKPTEKPQRRAKATATRVAGSDTVTTAVETLRVAEDENTSF